MRPGGGTVQQVVSLQRMLFSLTCRAVGEKAPLESGVAIPPAIGIELIELLSNQ